MSADLSSFAAFFWVFSSVLVAPCPAVEEPLAFLRLSRPEPMLPQAPNAAKVAQAITQGQSVCSVAARLHRISRTLYEQQV